jgi:hypothetical protein
MIPRDMRRAYARVRSNPQLLELREDVASLVVQQQRVLDSISATETPPWGEAVESWNDFKTAKTEEAKALAAAKHEQVIRTGAGEEAAHWCLWDHFNDLAQQKKRLVTAERKWLARLRNMYTAEQGLAVMHAVKTAALEVLGADSELLGRYLDRLCELMPDPDLKRIEAE